MRILVADYIYTSSGYLENSAILFNERILEILNIKTMIEKYPDVLVDFCEPNSVIYPGFINTHVHLEFSANQTQLKYGNFTNWLKSVIQNRVELMSDCSDEIMRQSCDNMLKSGITTFGAISSNGIDIKTCHEVPQRVVFFNEVIGSNEDFNENIYNDFIHRFSISNSYKSDTFIPAVALHSPYSVNNELAKKVVDFAKESNLLIASHLLESKSEREWLEDKNGELGNFLKESFDATKPANTINEYISLFDEIKTHFVHAVYATKDELEMLYTKGHSIAHCPRSNRLLGCDRLEIENIKCPISIATDGLSSNWSLNIFDELRAALMLHNKGDLELLSDYLIKSITSNAAEILNLNCGILSVSKDADFTIIKMPNKPKSNDEIGHFTILHTNNVARVYIKGVRYV
jgi:cytosine/adenosine deaminase-related metal-dependent hydrolase